MDPFLPRTEPFLPRMISLQGILIQRSAYFPRRIALVPYLRLLAATGCESDGLAGPGLCRPGGVSYNGSHLQTWWLSSLSEGVRRSNSCPNVRRAREWDACAQRRQVIGRQPSPAPEGPTEGSAHSFQSSEEGISQQGHGRTGGRGSQMGLEDYLSVRGSGRQRMRSQTDCR